MSTALHFAIFLGNKRLTETLLDMKASLEIPCSNLLRKSMGSEEVSRRFSYFQSVFGNVRFGFTFPIFLAFLKSDPNMCKLLIDRGAGREAINVETIAGPKVMSVLHFAAADRTTDYRQWQCLFHGFREYIDEPCPTGTQSTPLHIALKTGCTQGMQIAVESGADKEARDGASRTPLSSGVLGIPHDRHADPKTFEERTMCFRKFVELGASINSEGDSVLVRAVQYYAPCPVIHPLMRHLIYFLLDHHADIHGTDDRYDTNVVNEIIKHLLEWDGNPPAQELLKELLSDLVDRGLNLTMPEPGLPSPLYRVLYHSRGAEPKWLIDLLCENGATILEHELSTVFLRWCQMPRLWSTNQYDAWWQHQGQEEEIFQKWCKHPYNAWWWQHVKHIWPHTVELAYGEAFFHEDRKLYDILAHLPLPAPSNDVLVHKALASLQPWSWSLAVQLELEEDFRATWLVNGGENMIHITVRFFIDIEGYSAADATRDILHLRDKGMDTTFRNRKGKTPLDILLGSGSSKDGFMEVLAVLEGEVPKVQELA
ncbi:uncharacterized protein CPUR_05661 [Claviceps purpurea 20.1]|uniref:Uncharacterized protein n=1 Tax=Claviceps purpurea (strain 20.1) TaxID=1111077 RepID=M1W2E3_CLAP2|nr:uncharacterized protein CPUR_05661 [Claviceps purpurea 20.1]